MSVDATKKTSSHDIAKSTPNLQLQVVWHSRIWTFFSDKELRVVPCIARDFMSLFPLIATQRHLELALYYQDLNHQYLQRAVNALEQARVNTLFNKHTNACQTNQKLPPSLLLLVQNTQQSMRRVLLANACAIDDYVIQALETSATALGFAGLAAKSCGITGPSVEDALNVLEDAGEDKGDVEEELSYQTSSADEADTSEAEQLLPTRNRTALRVEEELPYQISSADEADTSEAEQLPPTGNRTALRYKYGSPSSSEEEGRSNPPHTLEIAGARYHFSEEDGAYLGFIPNEEEGDVDTSGAEEPPPEKTTARARTAERRRLPFSSPAVPPYKIPIPLRATGDRFTRCSFPKVPRHLNPPSDPRWRRIIQESQDTPGDGTQGRIAFKYTGAMAATPPTSAPRPPDTGDTTSYQGTEYEDDTF